MHEKHFVILAKTIRYENSSCSSFTILKGTMNMNIWCIVCKRISSISDVTRTYSKNHRNHQQSTCIFSINTTKTNYIIPMQIYILLMASVCVCAVCTKTKSHTWNEYCFYSSVCSPCDSVRFVHLFIENTNCIFIIFIHLFRSITCWIASSWMPIIQCFTIVYRSFIENALEKKERVMPMWIRTWKMMRNEKFYFENKL